MFHNQFLFNGMEARGVEPLSFKRSPQPSTCLYGLYTQGEAANRHATHPRAATKSIHSRPRPPRLGTSLLSSHPGLAGVCRDTSRSIKPRERDLRNLHLFCLIRFFTRPTNHPRHAGRASHLKSKPVRPPMVKIVTDVFRKATAGSRKAEFPAKPPRREDFRIDQTRVRKC